VGTRGAPVPQTHPLKESVEFIVQVVSGCGGVAFLTFQVATRTSTLSDASASATCTAPAAEVRIVRIVEVAASHVARTVNGAAVVAAQAHAAAITDRFRTKLVTNASACVQDDLAASPTRVLHHLAATPIPVVVPVVEGVEEGSGKVTSIKTTASISAFASCTWRTGKK
jgi:hypothetical protein